MWLAATTFAWTVRAVAAADSSTGDKAVAEALFNDGVALVAAGDFARGCAKLEGSQALDATLGTALRLADCYDHVGKTASAWALFKEAEGIAHRQGASEREAIARARADALLPRLSYLIIRVQGEVAPGLSITKNQTVLPLASLGVAIPVDPGVETVTASAPGYVSWSGKIQVLSGPSTQTLDVPRLRPAPASVAAPLAASAPPPPAARAAVPELTPTSAPPRDVEAPLSARKVIGVSAVSVGTIGVLAGLGMGWYAKQQNDESRRRCPFDAHNGCTSEGVRLRARAERFALASTITTVAGGAILTTGIVLWATAPNPSMRASASNIRLTSAVGPQSFATTIEGAW